MIGEHHMDLRQPTNGVCRNCLMKGFWERRSFPCLRNIHRTLQRTNSTESIQPLVYRTEIWNTVPTHNGQSDHTYPIPLIKEIQSALYRRHEMSNCVFMTVWLGFWLGQVSERHFKTST